MVLKNCVVCEMGFNAIGNKKTCSKKCSERRMKEKKKASDKKWYDNNPDYFKKWRENHPNHTKEWYHKRKQKLVDMLGGKCEVCGYRECLSALEFHHVDPNEKESRKEWQKKGFEKKILAGKIQLLCSNNHREKHNDF